MGLAGDGVVRKREDAAVDKNTLVYSLFAICDPDTRLLFDDKLSRSMSQVSTGKIYDKA